MEPETFPKPVDGAAHHTRIFLQKKRIEVGNHDQVPKIPPKKIILDGPFRNEIF